MRGPDLLYQYADVVKTKMGGFIPGVRAVFRGYDIHKDLKDMDWLELYVFGITGRHLTKEQLRILHAVFVFTSYPDTRLWNNRIAALTGSARSTGCLGIAAALAASDAIIYGGSNYSKATEFFVRTHKAVENGANLSEYVTNEMRMRRGISGYGRPITSADERNEPLMILARSLGEDKGPHVNLALEIEKILIEGRWRRRLNFAGLVAAFAADFGFSPQENYLILFPCFMAGMLPCYIEATEKPEGALLPLSVMHVTYEGHEKRPWPKK